MTGYEPPTALPRPLLKRPDVKAALAAHDFGTVFFVARSEAGITYSQIATECGIKPERVGTLAKGRGSVTTYEKIVAIADALRIPGHMVGLAARPWEAPPKPDTDDDSEGVHRRKFLKTSAKAGLAVSLPDLPWPSTSGRVGSDVPQQLRKRTARLRRLDDVLGGGDTFRVYLGEYHKTRTLLRDGSYDQETGRQLLSVLAEQAQQAGWAAFDGGRQAEATGLYEASRKAALEANDAALAGNALAFLAYQQLSDDRQTAVKIAARSCVTAGPDAAPGVRALLYERLAWAHAVANQPDETHRALEAAHDALADVDDTPQPDWTTWVDNNELQIMTGRCWTELRRPLRAVPVLEKALAGFDDAHARDKSLYLSWLATSYLHADEVEQAATTACRALDLCAEVASVRPRQRLAPLLHQLAQHHQLPAVREVLDKAQVS